MLIQNCLLWIQNCLLTSIRCKNVIEICNSEINVYILEQMLEFLQVRRVFVTKNIRIIHRAILVSNNTTSGVYQFSRQCIYY